MAITSIGGLYLIALGLRIFLLPNTNYDTDGYVRWYEYIAGHGQFNALGDNFAIYTPPYLYLLSLATFTNPYLPSLFAIKLIPVLFDLINSLIVYKIVRLKHPSGVYPFLAAGIFLLAPTILINSAYWGQIDSLYTCFLLGSIYFILTGRPTASMIAFGISAAIKAQAAFLLPFLILMALKKRIAWRSFALVPVVYLAMMFPAIIAGRPVVELFTIYLSQANELQIPSFNAPNLYIFIPQSYYEPTFRIGLAVTIILVSIWIAIYARRKFPLTPDVLLYFGLVSAAMAPFLLPKMHDRYFYPADVLSMIVCFYRPKLWFVAAAFQVLSLLAYSIFLFHSNRQVSLILATQLSTFTLLYLLWNQSRLVRESAE